MIEECAGSRPACPGEGSISREKRDGTKEDIFRNRQNSRRRE
jgi:hypothetical protein